MKLMDRYIGRAVIASTVVVMAVLLSLYLFSTLINEMGEVGKGDYTSTKAVLFSLMMMPRQVYELFPLGALLGTMLGMGALANHSELTVLRAAGVSVGRIVLSVLKAGLLMVVVVTLLGELAAPELEKFARTEKARSLSENLSLNTREGLWARVDNTFVNIRQLMPDGRANGVSLYRFDEGLRLQEVLFAPSAEYVEGAWYLRDAQVTELASESAIPRSLDEYVWRSSLDPAVVGLVTIPPENLAIRDLYGYVSYMRANGLDAKLYELSLWVRIMAPLSAAGMILLAIPFIFGSTRSVGVGQRIMTGAFIGIIFYMFNAIFSRLGLLYGLPPMLGAMLPTLLVFAAWAMLMRRVH